MRAGVEELQSSPHLFFIVDGIAVEIKGNI